MAQPITEEVPAPASPSQQPERLSTIQLVRTIAGDTATLVRKEVELARHEMTAAIRSRVLAVAALAVAGVFGLLVLIFLAVAGAAALDLVFARWLSRLIVAGGFLLLAGAAAMFGLRKMKKPSFAPEETKRTVKEDVEWAKAQLKR